MLLAPRVVVLLQPPENNSLSEIFPVNQGSKFQNSWKNTTCYREWLCLDAQGHV